MRVVWTWYNGTSGCVGVCVCVCVCAGHYLQRTEPHGIGAFICYFKIALSCLQISI